MTQEKANGAQKVNQEASAEHQVQDWLIGRMLGKYELIRPIGFGSFASIYEAVHVHLRVPFAIKVLHPAFINHEEVVKRFFREGQAASQLQHENVVFIADFDMEEDVGPYIVMEYLEGSTLKDHLSEKGSLPIQEVGEIARQICEALTLAHSKGIIHRDLKPENIFLVPRSSGRSIVKILDFGIAHLADCSESITGARLLGTPVYMAPEQFRGETHSSSLDIYSFGILLYEMLTGSPPFKGKNVQQLGIEHLLIPAPELADTFPKALKEIQAQLLAKKPIDRPSSMEEVWTLLALAIDPSHSFTHWHQEAIDPLVAAKMLGEKIPIDPTSPPPSQQRPTTDTMIEPLDEYNFQDAGQAEHADTAKESSPSIPTESKEFSTSKNLPPTIPLRTSAPPENHPDNDTTSPGGLKSPSDTAEEGLTYSEVQAEIELQAKANKEKLEPLPPLPPVDTAIMPLNNNGTPKELLEQFSNLPSTQGNTTQANTTQANTEQPDMAPPMLSNNTPVGSTPPLSTTGTAYPAVPHPSMPFPSNPSSLDVGNRTTTGPLPSSRGVLHSHSTSKSSRLFGRMGSKEKQLLIVVWIGVLIVVGSVFSLIFKTIQSGNKKKAPIKRSQTKPKQRQRSNRTQSNEQKIMIQTNPSGAKIYLDGTYIGSSPLQIQRPFGSTLSFRLELETYLSHEVKHKVTSFENYSITHTFTKD